MGPNKEKGRFKKQANGMSKDKNSIAEINIPLHWINKRLDTTGTKDK